MSSPLLPPLLLLLPGLLAAAEQVAVLEVSLEQQPGVCARLQGEVLESSRDGTGGAEREELEGNLVLVREQRGGFCPGLRFCSQTKRFVS